MSRRVSVSTALFDGHGMDRAVEEIAAAGATHVEPAFIRGYVDFDEADFSESAAAALEARLAAAGLRAGALSAHFDLGDGEAGAMLARRLRFAARLGAPFLVTNAGHGRGRNAVMAALDAALPLCEETGVTLALENPGHGTGDLIGGGAEGRLIVQAVGSPFVRLNYDAGNVFTYSREALRPEQDILAALPALAHLHLKDVASDPGGWRFVPIGAGAIRWSALWRLLPADMPVGIELPLRLSRPMRRDPVRRAEPLPIETLRAALAQSLAFVRRLDGG